MSTFAEIIKKAEKEWDCENLMSSAKAPMSFKFSFSSPLMNWFSYGGVPRGKISEFVGQPGSGKSTSAMDICKNVSEYFQKEYDEKVAELHEKVAKGDKLASAQISDLEESGPRKVLYVDLEHGFDKKWASVIGVDTERIEIMQPPNVAGEDILQKVMDLIQTGEVGFVVLDSIPSLVPRSELEKKLGEPTVAALANLMTVFMRKVVPVLKRFDCTLILINQIRPNMKNPYDDNTPGGIAVRFYSSVIMKFQLGNPVDFLGNVLPQNTENPAGYVVNVRMLKQKTAPFDRKNATYFLMCSSGIRPDFDYAQLAVNKYGIIKKAAAWFTILDPYTGEVLEENEKPVKVNGMAKVYEYLETHPEYYQKLQKFICDDINGVTGEENETDEILQ